MLKYQSCATVVMVVHFARPWRNPEIQPAGPHNWCQSVKHVIQWRLARVRRLREGEELAEDLSKVPAPGEGLKRREGHRERAHQDVCRGRGCERQGTWRDSNF